MSMPLLLPLFEWCDRTAIGTWIRTGSGWAFPIIETCHILALTLLFGTVLIVDLRLLGAGLRRQPVSWIAAELAQCHEELLREGAPGLHFYTLHKARSTTEVLTNLGLAGRSRAANDSGG